MENKSLYVCYSIPQREYLKRNNIKYEVGGKSITTDKPFWVYVRNKKLDECLSNWSIMKN